MKVAILSANLRSFDTNTHIPVKQDFPDGVDEIAYHRFTDEDFPPITDWGGRLQYRIPKLFGWEMFPGYDYYIWLDGSISFKRPDSVKWYLDTMGDKQAFFFFHPWRHSIREETDHITKYLEKGSKYIVPRYKNGLHKEMYKKIYELEPNYKDDFLLASTVFAYKNTPEMQKAMQDWWLWQSRYYSVDQLAQTFVFSHMRDKIHIERVNLFEIGYVSLMSHH